MTMRTFSEIFRLFIINVFIFLYINICNIILSIIKIITFSFFFLLYCLNLESYFNVCIAVLGTGLNIFIVFEVFVSVLNEEI